MLPFPIDSRAGLPAYLQVVHAAKRAIVLGLLPAGAPFPSVRLLSKELRINRNTAQKAVTKLVSEELLSVRPGV